MSQNAKQKIAKEKYNNGLLHTKVSLEDRDHLFHSIQKGQNVNGGKYKADINTHLKSSPHGDTMDGRQKYQHSQKDPIIVRGNQNVLTHHLVVRSFDLNK